MIGLASLVYDRNSAMRFDTRIPVCQVSSGIVQYMRGALKLRIVPRVSDVYLPLCFVL